MNGRRWLFTETQALNELFIMNIPDSEIAQILGRSQIAIKVKRKKMGMVGNPRARRLSEEARQRMRIKPTGSDSSAWKGGRRISSSGYVELFVPDHPRARANGYVFEHIIVLEKKLGRSLLPDEETHHKDENKQNNSPENLQSVTHMEHLMIHGLTKERHGKYLICPICQKLFYVKASQAAKRTTCSVGCAGVLFRRYYTGKPRDYRIPQHDKELLRRKQNC